MSFFNVEEYFKSINMEDKILVFDKSSATVEEAAKAVETRPCQIAKTLSFLLKDKPILIVTAGDAKVDNKKYKGLFSQKMKMIPFDEVEYFIGHSPGGVCPFAIKSNVSVYLDISLKRFDKVYPAAGDDHSAVMLSIKELEDCSGFKDWVDVCKDWDDMV